MELFLKTVKLLKVVHYFCKKAPLHILDWALNMPRQANTEKLNFDLKYNWANYTFHEVTVTINNSSGKKKVLLKGKNTASQWKNSVG